MKKMIRLITLGAIVTMLALPIIAKSLTGTEVLVQEQCTQENKDAYYKTFLDNRKTEQQKAYENAKKYLACPPGEVTEASQKIVDYLKLWVGKYEEASKQQQLPILIYNKKDYPAAYALGRELTTAEPENLKYLIDLGANGYLLAPLKNASLNNDAVGYARKAIQMLEAGKTVENWAPLTGKDDSLAYLNYTIGSLTLDTDPSNALKNLLKAAQFETPLKKEPYTYGFIGAAYESGPYAKLSDQYKVTFQGKDETPESKLALANINQIVDRMIDAYARAVALAGNDAKYTEQKKVWTASLTDWYKYRNKSDAGIAEFLASVLSKPLPPEPTPLTSLPAAPATPATASTTPPATTTQPAPAGAKPTPKATPGPNKPRNNHK